MQSKLKCSSVFTEELLAIFFILKGFLYEETFLDWYNLFIGI